MADISRADVATLIQEEYTNILLTNVSQKSAAIEAFGSIPLGTKITNAPVLATLPTASWVSEAPDATGVKPTSEASWSNKRFVVEEIAVIIPIHEDVLEDATDDTVMNLTDMAGSAIGRVLDQAVLFGLNKPATWTDNALIGAAVATGNVFMSSTTAGASDLAGSIFKAAESVAETGANPTTILSASGLKYRLANLRAMDGSTILTTNLGTDGKTLSNQIAGLDAAFVKNGAWNNAEARAIIVDRDRIKIGVRQDVTVKFLDQATVNGLNLAERDMVAFRFKARYAYVLGNTLNAAGAATIPVAAVI